MFGTRCRSLPDVYIYIYIYWQLGAKGSGLGTWASSCLGFLSFWESPRWFPQMVVVISHKMLTQNAGRKEFPHSNLPKEPSLFEGFFLLFFSVLWIVWWDFCCCVFLKFYSYLEVSPPISVTVSGESSTPPWKFPIPRLGGDELTRAEEVCKVAGGTAVGFLFFGGVFWRRKKERNIHPGRFTAGTFKSPT